MLCGGGRDREDFHPTRKEVLDGQEITATVLRGPHRADMVDAGGVPGFDIPVRNQLEMIWVVRLVAATTAVAFPLHDREG